MKKFLKLTFICFGSLVILLFLIRLILPIQLDDVSSGIYCESELLERSDVYFVIPAYQGIPISDDINWCEKILSYNKTLAMHGVRHTYEEFGGDISEEDLTYGMDIFKKCFGYLPERFKPPQMKINQENTDLVGERLKLVGPFNQLFHKTYHCEDTGVMPNWLVRII